MHYVQNGHGALWVDIMTCQAENAGSSPTHDLRVLEIMCKTIAYLKFAPSIIIYLFIMMEEIPEMSPEHRSETGTGWDNYVQNFALYSKSQSDDHKQAKVGGEHYCWVEWFCL